MNVERREGGTKRESGKAPTTFFQILRKPCCLGILWGLLYIGAQIGKLFLLFYHVFISNIYGIYEMRAKQEEDPISI